MWRRGEKNSGWKKPPNNQKPNCFFFFPLHHISFKSKTFYLSLQKADFSKLPKFLAWFLLEAQQNQSIPKELYNFKDAVFPNRKAFFQKIVNTLNINTSVPVLAQPF